MARIQREDVAGKLPVDGSGDPDREPEAMTKHYSIEELLSIADKLGDTGCICREFARMGRHHEGPRSIRWFCEMASVGFDKSPAYIRARIVDTVLAYGLPEKR